MSEEKPKRVREIDAAALLTECRDGKQPVLLDCREPYEWRQVRIPGSLHMPLDQIPQRLFELNKAIEVTVICAHGIRSYAVADYLIQNGFKARSLRGGIETWQMRGGKVDWG